MNNEIRKQRLMREALGNSDGALPSAESSFLTITMIGIVIILAVALSGSREGRKDIFAANIADARVVSADMTGSEKAPAIPQASVGTTEPTGNVQDLTY